VKLAQTDDLSTIGDAREFDRPKVRLSIINAFELRNDGFATLPLSPPVLRPAFEPAGLASSNHLFPSKVDRRKALQLAGCPAF
jgi:hypothetical protein